MTASIDLLPDILTCDLEGFRLSETTAAFVGAPLGFTRSVICESGQRTAETSSGISNIYWIAEELTDAHASRDRNVI